jgi:fucose permease
LRGRELFPGSAATIPLLTFIVLGLPAGAVGVAWPPMRATFGAPLAGLGLLLAAVTVAYFVGSLFTGPLAARTGEAPLVACGCALAAAGLIGLSVATQWWMIPILGLPLGAGAGFIDAAMNAYVSLNRGIRYMGWLHASWAVGAALGPQLVVISLSLTRSWRGAFAVGAIAFLLCGVGMASQTRAWARTTRARSASATNQPPPSIGYFRVVAFLTALFLLAAGLEATAGDWAYTQLTLGRSMEAALASWGATLFWSGLAGGRVALGLIGHRVDATRLLDAGVVLSVLAAAVFWIAPPVVAAFVALPLIGFAVSVLFPLLLSLTPSRVGTTLTGHVVGYGIAAGTLGGGALPSVIGVVLQDVGLWTLGPILTGIAVALALLHAVSRGGAQRSARQERDQLAL